MKPAEIEGDAMRTITRGAVALVLILAGSTPGLADSPAKVDHSYANPPAIYPDSAQLAGEQGDVLVDVRVTASGRLSGVRINQSSGFADLDNAAVETVLNWRFVPAIEDGDTVTSWTTVKIHYALPQTAPPATASVDAVDEHEINDHCTRPAPPPVIDGATATEAQMVKALASLQDFVQASDHYQTCLRLYIGGQEDLTMFVKTSVPEWKRKGVERKIAANQKDKEAVGESYNAAVLKYKARTSH
jgi:TonB family protein